MADDQNKEFDMNDPRLPSFHQIAEIATRDQLLRAGFPEDYHPNTYPFYWSRRGDVVRKLYEIVMSEMTIKKEPKPPEDDYQLGEDLADK